MKQYKNKIWIIILFLVLTNTLKFVIAQNQDRRMLLVINIQENLFMPESKIHINTNRLYSFIENANSVITYFFKHNIEIIYIVNEWTNPFVNFFTGNVCKKGSAGTNIDKRIQIVNSNIFSKSVPDSFSNKAFLEHLKSKSITELYIVGLMAEACVKKTALSAQKLGFKVTVIENAVASKNIDKKNKTLRDLKHKNIKIERTIDLFSLLI